MRVGGALRAVIAVVAGGGLVYAATLTGATLDTTRASDAGGGASATVGTSSQLVCPGPDGPGSAESGYDPQSVQILSALAPTSALPKTAARATPGTVTSRRLPGSSGGAPPVPDAPGDNRAAQVRGAGAVQVDASGSRASGLVVMQTSQENTKTARGLQVASCRPAARQAWLPAGGPQPGRAARLVLSNPGGGPVSVDATVFGASGRLGHKSPRGIVVPAGGRKVVVIGDLDAAGAHPMVHVKAHDGMVAAAVVDTLMTGETRSGQALITPAAPPATTQVLPAVADVGPDPVVRVAVPGSAESIVRVRATDPAGKVAADQVATVHGGATGAITLKGLKAGLYSVRVTADEPVVASALTRTATSGTADFAWMPSSEAITEDAGFVLAEPGAGARRQLLVSSPGKQARIVLTTRTRAGKTDRRTVTVPADRPVSVTVTDDVSGWITVVSGRVYAGVTLAAKDDSGALIAAAALHPTRSAGVTTAHAAGD